MPSKPPLQVSFSGSYYTYSELGNFARDYPIVTHYRQQALQEQVRRAQRQSIRAGPQSFDHDFQLCRGSALEIIVSGGNVQFGISHIPSYASSSQTKDEAPSISSMYVNLFSRIIFSCSMQYWGLCTRRCLPGILDCLIILMIAFLGSIYVCLLELLVA